MRKSQLYESLTNCLMINDLIEVYCNVLTVTIINCFHPVRGVVN